MGSSSQWIPINIVYRLLSPSIPLVEVTNFLKKPILEKETVLAIKLFNRITDANWKMGDPSDLWHSAIANTSYTPHNLITKIITLTPSFERYILNKTPKPVTPKPITFLESKGREEKVEIPKMQLSPLPPPVTSVDEEDVLDDLYIKHWFSIDDRDEGTRQIWGSDNRHFQDFDRWIEDNQIAEVSKLRLLAKIKQHNKGGLNCTPEFKSLIDAYEQETGQKFSATDNPYQLPPLLERIAKDFRATAQLSYYYPGETPFNLRKWIENYIKKQRAPTTFTQVCEVFAKIGLIKSNEDCQAASDKPAEEPPKIQIQRSFLDQGDKERIARHLLSRFNARLERTSQAAHEFWTFPSGKHLTISKKDPPWGKVLADIVKILKNYENVEIIK